jgi:hypothetical protein
MKRSQQRPLPTSIDSSPEVINALLTHKWRLANMPDNNLGAHAVGPSPQKMRQTACIKILQAMGVDSEARFVDFGSGHGLVCMTAAAIFGANSYGIELDRIKVDFALRNSNDITPQPAFETGDLTLLTRLQQSRVEQATHIYAFDRDFPPSVMLAIIRNLMNNTNWQCFASARDLRYWGTFIQKHAHQLDVEPQQPNASRATGADELVRWFLNNTVLDTQLSGALCGSGEQHMMYIYRPRRRQQRRQNQSPKKTATAATSFTWSSDVTTTAATVAATAATVATDAATTFGRPRRNSSPRTDCPCCGNRNDTHSKMITTTTTTAPTPLVALSPSSEKRKKRKLKM